MYLLHARGTHTHKWCLAEAEFDGMAWTICVMVYVHRAVHMCVCRGVCLLFLFGFISPHAHTDIYLLRMCVHTCGYDYLSNIFVWPHIIRACVRIPYKHTRTHTHTSRVCCLSNNNFGVGWRARARIHSTNSTGTLHRYVRVCAACTHTHTTYTPIE